MGFCVAFTPRECIIALRFSFLLVGYDLSNALIGGGILFALFLFGLEEITVFVVIVVVVVVVVFSPFVVFFLFWAQQMALTRAKLGG